MSEFLLAIPKVLKHENGFQADPNDRGNWTSGEVGVGELVGTNHGISAASYPNEDIKNLTVERATEIYERDFWVNGQYGELVDQDVATKLLDIAVTMERFGRHGPAVRILQTAIVRLGGDPGGVDGTMGPHTIAAANGLEGPALLAAVKSVAVDHYREIAARNPREQADLAGWEARANS